MLTVELTADGARDPVFGSAPASFPSFHWHGDTYELPDGAARLARSALYPQQAFVFGRAYALQFHLEVSARLVTEWARVPAYADSLASLPGTDPMPAILQQLAAAEAESLALARRLFSRWLVEVAALPGTAPR